MCRLHLKVGVCVCVCVHVRECVCFEAAPHNRAASGDFYHQVWPVFGGELGGQGAPLRGD